MDQTGGKGVPAPDTVYDIGYLIARARPEFLLVPEDRRPDVPIGALAFPERDGHKSEVGESFQDAGSKLFVGSEGKRPGGDVRFTRDSQGFLAIFLVADGDIGGPDNLAHQLGCRRSVLPELAAEVEVDRHPDPACPGSSDGLEAQVRRRRADGRGSSRRKK